MQVYVICGSVTYGFSDQDITLGEGDTFYFDESFRSSVKYDFDNQAV